MENKILAIVGDSKITQEDLDRIINRYPEDKKGYFNSEQGKKQLLEQTISFELMSRMGAEMQLDKTEDFKKTIEAMKKELLTQVTINKVLSDVTVTDEEVKKYYDDNKGQFLEKSSVSAKHILVKTEEEAKKIEKEINDKELSFEEAAQKYSTCPSKEQGGDLGPFSRGMMVPEFEEVAFKNEINMISKPVKTQFGYHLILTYDKTQEVQKEFDEVKDLVIGQLTEAEQQKKYLALTKELEGKYKVERK